MKKILALVLACVLVLGLFAGCGAAETPAETTAPAEPAAPAVEPTGVEITYWSMWNSNEPHGEVIAEAAAAFEAQTGVKVNIEWKGRELNQLLAASLEAGEKFDIFDDDMQRIMNSHKDYVYDLTEMAEAAGYFDNSYACLNNPVIEKAGFLACVVEQPQVGGVFYDKDAFANAGIEAAPTTWAEYMDVCAALKESGVGPQALDAAYTNFTVYHQLVRHLGEAGVEELAVNGGWGANEQAVAAFQEVVDLVKAGYLVDGAPDEFPSSENKIGFGLAAMVVCGDYVMAEVNNNTETEVNWGFFGYPAVEGGVDNTSVYGGANSFAITKYSEHPQEAFDFLMFLTTGEWDQKMADVTGGIPCDSRNTCTALPLAVDTLVNGESLMSWCAGLNANDSLKDSFKAEFTKLYEGKYESGEAFCAALDALY